MRPSTLLLAALPLLFPSVASAAPDQPSLAAVGDIGKVVDCQGVTSFRPAQGSRWSHAPKGTPLKPGDWLRTDVRGANALKFVPAHSPQDSITLGPDTLVELVDKRTIKLVHGEIELAFKSLKTTRTVIAPDGKSHDFSGEPFVLRVLKGGDGKLIPLENEPNWLKGFKGAVVSESMGQLVARVDGRDTPLTLGYHKVTVDIRDQIARTTIEESFVNHTPNRLEGIFYFPLPQDASIAGFGMWINGELVEADVVEKQRAREIYETILREKRDPGLLEWTGGNLFKARVFPIFGGSEKRIKITYTQVLPYRNGSYRYSYALQSEMLQRNPLRELLLDVRVYSEQPIAKFTCPTHPARISTTANSARAEFTAQEYIPSRDFEIEIEIDRKAAPVTVIPHRRGEDGYFLALITPPGDGDAWQRDLVEDGDPIELVILADTSGSMTDAARDAQDALLGALLGALGPDDRFQLATCDNEVRWFQGDDPLAARQFLSERDSLGWSDLEAAFAAVAKRVRKAANAHVLYIGDGVITTGDADPVAFAQRLRREHGKLGASFHAVAPSSSFESGVLEAIASLGGGSVRRIEGSDTPAVIANQLLAEIAAPGLREMQVEFKGLRTARVYPERLPNLAAGRQQILIGRYLPTGGDRTGEIVVSGIRGGKRVSYRAPIALRDAESGNSFIPRLWARMHLDALLAQGRSAEIRDEVIALSEEYHIMTPYTSFLVLESDEDRERFKVKRRFLMRDGERFFADGRDKAAYELLQQQMKIAGSWRLNLQRAYIRELRTIGRHLHRHPPANPYWAEKNREMRRHLTGLPGMPMNRLGKPISGHPAVYPSPVDQQPYEASYEGGERSSGEDYDLSAATEDGSFGDDDGDWAQAEGEGAPPGESAPPADKELAEALADRLDSYDYDDLRARGGKRLYAESRQQKLADLSGGFGNQGWLGTGPAANSRYMVGFRAKEDEGLLSMEERMYRPGPDGYHWRSHMQDLVSMFPHPWQGSRAPGDRKDHPWPKRAIEIADGLLRNDELSGIESGGVQVEVIRTVHNKRFAFLESRETSLYLYGGDSWLAVTGGVHNDRTVNWWADGERGILKRAFRLGGMREPVDGDRDLFIASTVDASFASLADSLRTYQVRVRARKDGEVVLVVTNEAATPPIEIRLRIDTARRVLLERETYRDGDLAERQEFTDFVKVAGTWWATRVRQTDAEGALSSEWRYEVRALKEKAYQAAFARELEAREKTVFLQLPLPELEDAKQAAADGKRSFESEIVLLQHYALSQQWDRAEEHFERMREFAGEGKPGFGLLEMRFDAMRRRGQEIKTAVLAAVRELAENPVDGEMSLALHLLSAGQSQMAHPERNELLELLKPIYYRAPRFTMYEQRWDQAWMQSLQNIGRPAEALAMAKAIAQKYSWDLGSQISYVNMLANQGNRPAALEFLEETMEEERWLETERVTLRSNYIGQLDAARRLEDVKQFLEEWFESDAGIDVSWPYQRHAAVLVQLDQVERAHEMIEGWLQAAANSKGEDIDRDILLKLDAALNALFNSSWGVHRQVIEERFHGPLADIVRRFALSEKHNGYAARIMSDHRFHQTDHVRKLRVRYAKVLLERGEKLPLHAVQRLAQWIMANDPAVEADTWAEISAPLVERWSKIEHYHERDSWASVIMMMLHRVSAEAVTGFLRRQLVESPDEQRGRYASQLLSHLLTGEWSEGIEAEAFDLLYVIEPANQRIAEVGRDPYAMFRAGVLMTLNDWVLRSGYQVLYGAVEKKEDLSRIELREIQREKRHAIRAHLAARLATELEKREELTEGFSHWMNIERLYFDIAARRPHAEIAPELWEFLGKFDPLVKDDKRAWEEAVLITRYLDTLEYLAAHPKADPELVQRVLTLQRRGIDADEESDAWKGRHYRLLVALDRPGELKKALRSWIRPEKADSHWRVTLGYLLAELNEIEAAIREFELVEEADELRPREYRVLADWYLVRDMKAERERALLGYYETMPDHRISQVIQQRTARVRQGFENGVPEELDPEVPMMFAVLLRKSPNPHSYIYQLGELYRYTKDFRLLECVPEGVIGHTELQVYPFLQAMSAVHQHIRDEATSDLLLAHLEKVRARAETKIDHRGLDLLEMLVRRKASELLNQPGQHLPQALAAMKRAFNREWADGERKLMANFLFSLDRITQQPLAAEQLREMQVLHRNEPADTDRMEIGLLLGRLQWQYERRDEAIQTLEVVLRDAEDTGGGSLPQHAQQVLSTFLDFLVDRKRFARAEQEIFRVLGQEGIVDGLRQWTYVRRFRLYVQAVSMDGSLSLGKGEELYRAAANQIIGDITKVDNNLRYQIVDQLMDLYKNAHSKRLGDAAGDLREFAYGGFDELVSFETANYQQLVSKLASALKYCIGDREALAFLIVRYEREPASFRAQQQDAWRHHGNSMAGYFYYAKKNIGALESRFLKIVLAELRRDLHTRNAIATGLYSGPNGSHFWTAKKAEFERVAEEVLEEKRQSEQTVVYIARYLHDGLHKSERAIALLIDLYDRKLLDEQGWSMMIGYLQSAQRWPEVIDYLVPLIEFRPDNLSYRLQLMNACFRNNQRDELIATLDTIDERWHEKGWWNEGTLASVASQCHSTQLWKRAVEYYEELIPLHQRSAPRRGIGNGTLSGYYMTLARCHSQLGDTPAAVEAASGAIVAWGSNITNRSNSLATLVQVLKESQDLGAYVKELDAQVGETGLENPIVRKALGQVYLQKKEYAAAIRQLTLAVQTQPNDDATHALLVQAYDEKGDAEGAMRQLFASTRINRRNIALYKQLGERLAALDREGEAERARTSIVEALPNESEGHAMLAEIRESQDRWEDAAAHWEQVSIIRELEPTGLQRLAKAQIRLGRMDEAKQTIGRLLQREWPRRFGSVHNEARNLLTQMGRRAG